MVDKNLVKAKVNKIQEDLRQLSRFKDYPQSKIIKDYDTHKIVERILELVINEAIDINQHLIAESNLGKLPYDFKESFTLLTNIKVYPKDFGKEISKSAGLRNILVHQYGNLDEKIFYQSIKTCLKQYHAYCNYILKYLLIA